MAPFLLYFWSRIALGHSSLSKSWIFTKTIKNQCKKNNIFDPKIAWKSIQNRTKTIPRGDFFALQFAPHFLIDFCSVWAPKMPHFGDPFCSQNGSKKYEKIEEPQKPPRDHPISPQDGPRSPQETPKVALRPPNFAPRRPKIAPRDSKRPPREPRETPKAPQEGPRAPQEAKRSPQSLPRAHKLSQNCFPQIACRKRRAGGGDPPWGRQSAARPVGAEPSVLDS